MTLALAELLGMAWAGVGAGAGAWTGVGAGAGPGAGAGAGAVSAYLAGVLLKSEQAFLRSDEVESSWDYAQTVRRGCLLERATRAALASTRDSRSWARRKGVGGSWSSISIVPTLVSTPKAA